MIPHHILVLCTLAKVGWAFAPMSTHHYTMSRHQLRKENHAQLLASTQQPSRPNSSQDLFKAGLLANLDNEAAALASKKLKTVRDLGWTQPAKRRGNTRPRHWAFGGAGEKAVQDKPNYDPASPMCVEKWLSLSEFYTIVKDDTAVADTIFVALAGGGAFIEREVAEDIFKKWRPDGRTFDEDAFMKTVEKGRQDFLVGWVGYIFVTGFAILGIVAPTNPVQLALVNALSSVLGR